MKLRLFYANGGNHPVIGQVLHRCQEILEGEGKARYQRYLANTLGDIAQSIEDCNQILLLIDSITAGEKNDAEIEGDPVEVFISKTGVQINININEDWVGQDEGRFTLSEFRVAVEGWKNFLLLPESFNSEVLVAL